MVWAILLLLGVPLWLCAMGITVTVLRNRSLRTRHGDIPVRVRRPGKKRWTRGHAIWVSDVFAWRGSPAAWSEDIFEVTGVALRNPDEDEQHELRRLGDGAQIATLTSGNETSLDVAVAREERTALAGPFVAGLEASTEGARRIPGTSELAPEVIEERTR